VEKLVVPPTNLTALVAHMKKDIKEERFILDSVKDHLISHLFEKKKAKRYVRCLGRFILEHQHE